MRPEVLKTAKATRLATLAAAAVALTLTGLSGCENQAEKAYRERYAKAEALFKERCKTAGVVIHRTVKDVEGIELTKVRQPVPWAGKEYFDPMWAEAAMAGESRGDDYIKQFLMYEFLDPRQPDRRGSLGPLTSNAGPEVHPTLARKGYSFVEVLQPSGGRLRCDPDWSQNHPNWVDGQHRCRPVPTAGTRYALDFEDIVDPVDRQHWIAGTTLKVIDKQTGELLARFTKYVWDPGFGVSSTGRWPWQHANSAASTRCPSDATQRLHTDSRYFIDTVLIPKQGDQP